MQMKGTEIKFMYEIWNLIVAKYKGLAIYGYC